MSIALSKLYLWRRSGIYYIGYVDEGGKDRWVSTKEHLKSEALKKYIDFQPLVQPKPATRTFPRFQKEFFEFAKTNRYLPLRARK